MAGRRERLARRRKSIGFTQESLAERLGVERSTVVRWEAGETEPLPMLRPKLAGLLAVSVEQLGRLLDQANEPVLGSPPQVLPTAGLLAAADADWKPPTTENM